MVFAFLKLSNMKKIGVFLILLLSCSCITIKGELKGLYSYFNKTDKLYPGLLVRSSVALPVCDNLKNATPKIIIVNGNQLRKCLTQSTHAVLYVWQPLCSSELCYAINVVQRECTKKNIDLYIVSEYYDGPSMQQDYKIDRPIFGVDVDYYQSSLCDVYIPKFMRDITGTAARNNKFIEFKNGLLQRTFDRIEAL